MRLRAVGSITFEEQMRVEIGSRLSTKTEPESIIEILRYGGVDRPHVEFAGIFARASLEIVLYEGLEHEDDILEAFELFEMGQEARHTLFALGKLHLTMLLPKGLTTVVRAWLHLQRVLLFKAFIVYRVEREVGLTGCTRHYSFLDEVGEHEFHDHVIDGEQPLAVVLF